MNHLLSNPEARRLFSKSIGCTHFKYAYTCERCIAKNILDGMCAPIASGDKYFYVPEQTIGSQCFNIEEFHPNYIRLPDWHQKPKHEHKFKCECGETK